MRRPYPMLCAGKEEKTRDAKKCMQCKTERVAFPFVPLPYDVAWSNFASLVHTTGGAGGNVILHIFPSTVLGWADKILINTSLWPRSGTYPTAVNVLPFFVHQIRSRRNSARIKGDRDGKNIPRMVPQERVFGDEYKPGTPQHVYLVDHPSKTFATLTGPEIPSGVWPCCSCNNVCSNSDQAFGNITVPEYRLGPQTILTTERTNRLVYEILRQSVGRQKQVRCGCSTCQIRCMLQVAPEQLADLVLNFCSRKGEKYHP